MSIEHKMGCICDLYDIISYRTRNVHHLITANIFVATHRGTSSCCLQSASAASSKLIDGMTRKQNKKKTKLQIGIIFHCLVVCGAVNAVFMRRAHAFE